MRAPSVQYDLVVSEMHTRSSHMPNFCIKERKLVAEQTKERIRYIVVDDGFIDDISHCRATMEIYEHNIYLGRNFDSNSLLQKFPHFPHLSMVAQCLYNSPNQDLMYSVFFITEIAPYLDDDKIPWVAEYFPQFYKIYKERRETEHLRKIAEVLNC